MRTQRIHSLLCAAILFVLPTHLDAMQAHGHEREFAKRYVIAGELLKSTSASVILDSWTRGLLAPGGFKKYEYTPEVEARLEDAWHRAVRGSFRVREILDEVREAYATSFSSAELTGFLEFCQSSLGRKITAIEKALYDRKLDEAAIHAEYNAALKLLNADPSRKRLIEELSELYGGTKAAADLVQSMTLASWLGAEAVKPVGQPRLSPKEVFNEIAKLRPRLMRELERHVLADSALRYLSLEVSELQELRKIAASPLGRRHSAFNTRVWARAMRRQMLQVGEQFVREWNRPRL